MDAGHRRQHGIGIIGYLAEGAWPNGPRGGGENRHPGALFGNKYSWARAPCESPTVFYAFARNATVIQGLTRRFGRNGPPSSTFSPTPRT